MLSPQLLGSVPSHINIYSEGNTNSIKNPKFTSKFINQLLSWKEKEWLKFLEITLFWTLKKFCFYSLLICKL